MVNQPKYKVIYLTGAPATGKSTLCKEVTKIVEPLIIFSYADELLNHINSKQGRKNSLPDLREASAHIVSYKDVLEVDKKLISELKRKRDKAHFIIDSHAVTKEDFGYRITPFNYRQLRKINPSIIVVLYSSPEEIISRILKQSQGRPTVTKFECAMHMYLQSSVAISYSIHQDCPLYFYDTCKSPSDLAISISDLF